MHTLDIRSLWSSLGFQTDSRLRLNQVRLDYDDTHRAEGELLRCLRPDQVNVPEAVLRLGTLNWLPKDWRWRGKHNLIEWILLQDHRHDKLFLPRSSRGPQSSRVCSDGLTRSRRNGRGQMWICSSLSHSHSTDIRRTDGGNTTW